MTIDQSLSNWNLKNAKEKTKKKLKGIVKDAAKLLILGGLSEEFTKRVSNALFSALQEEYTAKEHQQ